MVKIVLRRLGQALITIWGTITVVFILNRVVPSDPVAIMLQGTAATPEMEASIRAELGLDQPVLVQYFDYLLNLLRGDFGESLSSGEPALNIIAEQFPATVKLTLLAAILAFAGGILGGIVAARFRGSWLDRTIQTIGLAGLSMPSFWLGILLIMVFSLTLEWLPASGSGEFSTLILPMIALSATTAAIVARVLRDSMLEVMNEPFVSATRARGVRERSVVYRHVARNAFIPMLTIAGVRLGDMLAGTVVIETVFGRQGVGRVLFEAILAKDLPVVQAATILATIVYVAINMVVDMTYTLIDPRTKELR